MKTHNIKVSEKEFNNISSGDQTFLIAVNHWVHSFKKGDHLNFQEYDLSINKHLTHEEQIKKGFYTGREVLKQAGIVSEFDQNKGTCVLSLLNINTSLWSEEDLEVINDLKLSHTEASKIINRSVNSIFSKRTKLGIVKSCKGYRDPNLNTFTEEQDKLIKNCRKGELKTLSKKLEKPYPIVWNRQQILNGNY